MNENREFVHQFEEQRGEIYDTLIDITRVEVKIWGNMTDAAIMRCLAATRATSGRSAKVSEVANALELGVATVHGRLQKLQCWRDPRSGDSHKVVTRTKDGYAETEAGRLRNAEARKWIEPILRKYYRRCGVQ